MENSVILYTVILMLRKINYYSFYKFNNVFFAMPCVSLVTDQSKNLNIGALQQHVMI